MACILHIETSAKLCSLAVSLNESLIFNRIYDENSFSHASKLGVYAKEAIDFLQNRDLKLDAVAVSEGPGSYTGLRIGISEAKGLCYGFDIPLIAVSTLDIICHLGIYSGIMADFFCPMIDARRMEVYSRVFDAAGKPLEETKAVVVDESSYQSYLNRGKVAFLGDGSGKCQEVISSPQAMFFPEIYPTAEAMISLAEESFKNEQFVDTAYFEPFYLKEFQATVAKNKIF